MLLLHILVVSCCLLDLADSQECDNTFKGYLDCIAASVGDVVKGRALENEFANDFATLVSRSFDSSRTSNNNKCVLSNAELSTDIFGPDGPLRGCDTCIRVAGDLRDKFYHAPEATRKCLRDQFAAAVVDELQPCIRDRLGDFKFNVPPLPDFERNTQHFLDVVLKGISYRVMAYGRLYACGRAFPVRARMTEPILFNKTGLFRLHCDLNKSCRSKVPSNCDSKFGQVQSATCKCMVSKRDDWRAKFEQVRNSIENFNNPAACSSSIKNAVGIWRYKLQNAMKACIENKDNILASIGIDKAIDNACNEFEKLDANGRNQVVNAIRMVRNLLDSMNDRITRFCEVQC